MRGSPKLAAARLALSLAAVLAVPAAAHAADPLARLKAGCELRRSTDRPPATAVDYRICTAPIASFDGTSLDASLTLPVRAPRHPLPLIVFLHGFLNSKREYMSDTREGTGPDRGGEAYKTIRWNNVWFASRGYAVLNYSARGNGASGGRLGLASKELEVRDTRWLTGLLADDGAPLVRIDGRRIAAVGGSYGGGQAWLLLSTRGPGARQYGSWLSPAGRPLRLAAVVPGFTWTDLLGTLVPNGRARTSGPTDPRASERPFGIGKLSIIEGLFASSATKLGPEPLRWVLRLDAGEPFDENDHVLRGARRGLSDDRSALYQDGFFRALRGRRQRSIPVLAAQGWTDPIFPAEQSVRMYRRLRAARPRYPIALYFGDFEHLTAQVKPADFAYFHRLGNALLDHYLRGRGRAPRPDVRSAPTICGKRFGQVLRARRFGLLGPERLTLELAGPKLTFSPLVDLRAVAADPVLGSTLHGRGCTTTRVPPTAGVAAWSVPVTTSYTLVGMPRLTLRFHAAARDLELDSRLWDRAPDGTDTLVTRGAYRALRPDPRGAVATYELFGNHWRFEAGHRIVLEVAQADAPYLRPDNFPGAATIDRAELVLPGRD